MVVGCKLLLLLLLLGRDGGGGGGDGDGRIGLLLLHSPAEAEGRREEMVYQEGNNLEQQLEDQLSEI
jgi:hypothetical protein